VTVCHPGGMTYRPYPNRIRALKQSERRRFPLIRAVVTAEGDTIIESVGGRFEPRIVPYRGQL
jgi:hypothetical protein